MTCTESQTSPDNRIGKQITEDETILIVDRTGKKWDVTHAERVYGLKADNFQFGLGPDAIPPINFPEYFYPDEPGYPVPSGSIVIATTINDVTRAYPIFILKSHEIVNEVFIDAHVSIAY
jgi:hypothetical protein